MQYHTCVLEHFGIETRPGDPEIHWWLRKIREGGDIEPNAHGRPKGHGKLAPHRALLQELVAQDGDITLPELAGALEAATGIVGHSASIGRFLGKLGYTYKKSRWLPANDCAPV